MIKSMTKWNQSYHILACFMILLGVTWGLVGCNQESAAPVVSTATLTVTPAISQEKLAEYQEIFDIVWETVNEAYFDPEFNGVDWDAMYDEYLPRIKTAENEEAFYLTMNEMCFKLGVSHIAVLPPGSKDLEPVLSSPATVGIDVRLIDKQAVVTKVKAGSAADRAGLRTGYIILSVDDVTVSDGEELVEFRIPPFNERRLQGQILNVVLTKFYGETGQSIDVSYLDEKNQKHEVTLMMEPRAQEPFIGEGLPPMYVDFEASRLDGDIAYIQLDGFLPPILDGVLNAIQEMKDAPAMIIDIRGNPGGFFPVRKAIASQFFQEETLLWLYKTRPGLDLPGLETIVYTDPPDEPYLGPVVILVDVLSGSSSEEFSGVMAANQRATIIGMRTPGSDLVADIKVLPNGATFLYPIAQTQTADGTVFEDRGVIPDITVPLDRDDLLSGIDSQLEAAVQYLQEEKNTNGN